MLLPKSPKRAYRCALPEPQETRHLPSLQAQRALSISRDPLYQPRAVPGVGRGVVPRAVPGPARSVSKALVSGAAIGLGVVSPRAALVVVNGVSPGAALASGNAIDLMSARASTRLALAPGGAAIDLGVASPRVALAPGVVPGGAIARMSARAPWHLTDVGLGAVSSSTRRKARAGRQWQQLCPKPT